MIDLTLDAGHGGRDSGALGPTTKEKDNSLLLVQKVAALLAPCGKFNVHFTRTKDVDFCPGIYSENEDLVNRVNIADSYGGPLISFHNNSCSGQAYGNEVYAWKSGGEGEKIAKAIHARMAAQLDMVDRGVKFANWYVCRASKAPGVLIEYGFINSEEATILAKMDQAALAIAQGIGDYFGVSVTEMRKEEYDVLKVAVLLYSKEDYWAGADVAAKNGNCAIFVRGADKSVPAEAMSAKQLIVIGGSTTKHPNEVLLSGQTKFDTAAAVGKYLLK